MAHSHAATVHSVFKSLGSWGAKEAVPSMSSSCPWLPSRVRDRKGAKSTNVSRSRGATFSRALSSFVVMLSKQSRNHLIGIPEQTNSPTSIHLKAYYIKINGHKRICRQFSSWIPFFSCSISDLSSTSSRILVKSENHKHTHVLSIPLCASR